MTTNPYQYDVVFSLAGKQKNYVEKVAKYLQKHKIKVWFYKFKQVDLWGKNQIDAFSKIFTKSGKYCVIFISKEYTEKVWPNLERKFIQSRWLKDPEYLLPARFDDSLVIGIPVTTGYISLKDLTPKEFGDLIIAKITGKTSTSQKRSTSLRKPKVKQDFDPYEIRSKWIREIPELLIQRAKEVPGMKIYSEDVGNMVLVRVRFKNNTLYSLNIHKRAHLTGDDGISFHGTEGESTAGSGSSNAWGSFRWSKEKEDVVLEMRDLSLFEMLPSQKRKFTKKEFVDTLWDKICDIIEKNY